VIRDSRRSRELEAKSFGAYHHLVMHIISPKSWLKSFTRLGDPGMTLGRCSCGFVVFCAVHPRTVCACLASAAGGQSATPCGPFGGPFRQKRCFSVGGDFCTSGRSHPVFRTVRPFSGGQSTAARRTVRFVRRFLPSLISSFASSLVLLRVFQGIVHRTCS
jgi:hypothetical protein